MGHPLLRQPARPVALPASPEISSLIKDMLDTMTAAGGTGLAAPQIGEPFRVVIFQADPARAGEGPDESVGLTILLNPLIELLTAPTILGWEGCLSVPGLRGLVPRAANIRYRGIDADGRAIERQARGFHARVVQHEVDHLDGILYPQRMHDLSQLVFESELDWSQKGEMAALEV
jgi:peptide deformylase